jgi:zinc protease
VIAGDLSAAEGFALAEKWFGGWSRQGPADEPLPAAPEPEARVLVIDMPTENQTQIAVGQPGVPRNHPDYIALQIGNQIFGGSFNSRLNMKLRANEGLTYGASSYFEPSRFAGIFEASTFTRTEKTAEAIQMLVDLLKEFRENPATDGEFEEAKAFLSGSFAIATETASSVASRVLTAEVHGLGSDYWQKYRERLERTTRAEVEAAVRRFLKPERLAITAVGNAKEFAKALEAFGPVRVIPAEQLDLAAPDLVKRAK